MDQPIVICDPRTRWGTPCLRSTGITVGQVISLRRAGYSDLHVLEAFPALTADDLDAAVEWHERFGDDALGPQPPPPGADHPRIAVDPQIQGGHPVVRGTRITVDAICGLREDGHTLDEILEEYPQLTPDDVAGALAYDVGVKAS